MEKYILLLSCEDNHGIVAEVSRFLFENGAFILESSQFGDNSTNRFFMRCKFRIASQQAPDKTSNTNGASGDDGSDDSDGEHNSKMASFLQEKFSQNIAKKFNMHFEFHNLARKQKIVVLCSKAGHCLNDLLYREYHKSYHHSCNWQIACVVSNHTSLKYLADFYDKPFFHLPIDERHPKITQEQELLKIIKQQKADLIVLARYMQIISPNLCQELSGRAINIHHSFLPGFKGANPYAQAYNRGVKLIGATSHYITENLDEGPIIEQEVTRVSHANNIAELTEIGKDIENRVLARAVRFYLEHKILINGDKTVIFE